MKKLSKNSQLFLLVFRSYTKNFMSVQWFGAEKLFFELEQVLGGVHPECNCECYISQFTNHDIFNTSHNLLIKIYFLYLTTCWSEYILYISQHTDQDIFNISHNLLIGIYFIYLTIYLSEYMFYTFFGGGWVNLPSTSCYKTHSSDNSWRYVKTKLLS